MTDNTQETMPGIGVQDIENAIRIIDHACDQGAFKGWNTIQQVIVVRDRLAAFVSAVKPQIDGNQEEGE